MEKSSISESNKVMRLCMTALFVAIVCVGTFISVPLPIGYFNLGDAAVLLSAWLLGPIFGAIAAAAGSALADLLLGYVIYAPATAIIKGAMAVCAYFLSAALGKAVRSRGWSFVPRLAGAVVGEAIMIGGYFLYEATVLKYGMGATASLPGNATQAVCGAAIAVMAATLIERIPRFRSKL